MAKKAAKKVSRPRVTMIQRSRRVSPAEKAAYHQEAGAGRSRVRREFLGLTDSDEDAILARIERHLSEAVK